MLPLQELPALLAMVYHRERLLFDIAAPYLLTRRYNQSASSSAVSEPGVQGVISSVGASASGPFVREDCTLHETNGQAWSYPNQPSTSILFKGVASDGT